MTSEKLLPADLHNAVLYFVGIKGTGMSALAELMLGHGAEVYGSDTDEHFYTDSILTSLGIPYVEGFRAENVPEKADLVIYSAAYDPQIHPELLEAQRRRIPMMEYTVALGELSRDLHATGIAGVHGKTTTTAMAGIIIKELGVPAGVLVGSAVKGFSNRATYFGGSSYFVAETCEYRRHFLSFHPNQLVITSIDKDHLDYYRDYDDIESAFFEYAEKLPYGGTLIYCADDKGAARFALKFIEQRRDVTMVPYGFQAEGDFKIVDYRSEPGVHRFRLAGWKNQFKLRIPGMHSVLNGVAAAAAVHGILCAARSATSITDDSDIQAIADALETFSGSKRRSEVIGEQQGILFADDYGHHPEEIKTTLQGFRSFYPDRRLIVDFMSHTYTRTEALLPEFATAFSDADLVVLHHIYASAREKIGSVNGKTLFKAVQHQHPHVMYFEGFDEAERELKKILQPGDLFLTMGAGDNWRIGADLYNIFSTEQKI